MSGPYFVQFKLKWEKQFITHSHLYLDHVFSLIYWYSLNYHKTSINVGMRHRRFPNYMQTFSIFNHILRILWVYLKMHFFPFTLQLSLSQKLNCLFTHVNIFVTDREECMLMVYLSLSVLLSDADNVRQFCHDIVGQEGIRCSYNKEVQFISTYEWQKKNKFSMIYS